MKHPGPPGPPANSDGNYGGSWGVDTWEGYPRSNITDAQDDLGRALMWAKALDPDLTTDGAATLAAAAVLIAELTSLRGAIQR